MRVFALLALVLVLNAAFLSAAQAQTAAELKARCSQLISYYDRFGVGRSNNSDGRRNHTRIGVQRSIVSVVFMWPSRARRACFDGVARPRGPLMAPSGQSLSVEGCLLSRVERTLSPSPSRPLHLIAAIAGPHLRAVFRLSASRIPAFSSCRMAIGKASTA